MNKKLVNLAVAAAMAAPAAAMADAVLYGKLNVAIDYVDQDNRLTFDRAGNPVFADGFDGWGLSGNQGTRPWNSNPYNLLVGNNNGPSNRIGVKGSEDLGNGLKAIYQVEFGIDLTDTNNRAVSGSESVTMRNSYVGLAGNWGTFLMGRHDTPLKISTGPAAQGGNAAFRRKTPLAINFCDPNICAVGGRFSELDPATTAIGQIRFAPVGRALVMGQTKGLLRIYADKASGRLLGSEMIGPKGENLSHLICWSIELGLTAGQMLRLPFYHPVIEEALQAALYDLYRQVDAKNSGGLLELEGMET